MGYNARNDEIRDNVTRMRRESKPRLYHANANQCEARAQEMPPTLRREFLVLAENWRKLASKAAEAEVEDRAKKADKA
jgi:hypothetical protein